MGQIDRNSRSGAGGGHGALRSLHGIVAPIFLFHFKEKDHARGNRGTYRGTTFGIFGDMGPVQGELVTAKIDRNPVSAVHTN